MFFSDALTPKIRQALASASVGCLLIMMMSTWAYPAAFLPQIEGEESDIHMSKEQKSWFATVTLLMCIPGSLVGAAAYEWYGPRRTMLLFTPILGLSTAAMAVSSLKSIQDYGYAEMVLLATRVVQGSVVAILNPFIAVYTYEVCDQRIRGVMTSAVETWSCLGYLASYISGCIFSWHTIAWLLPLMTLVPSFIGLQMSPESPLWLARKGREKEAKEILMKLRSTEKEIEEDLNAVRSSMNANIDTSSLLKRFLRMMKKSNIKAITASCLILTINQMTGFAVITIYVVQIFSTSGLGLDPSWSSVVVGTSRTIFSLVSNFILHRISRRFMLAVGNTITGLSSLTVAIFFYFQSTGSDVSLFYWLPLLCLSTWMVGYASAVGSTTWTVSVELLPGPVRSSGYGIATTVYAVAAFVLSKVFVDLQTQIGLHGVFFIFAGGSFSFIIFISLCIPETFGKSIQEIQNYWENSRDLNDLMKHQSKPSKHHRKRGVSV